MDNGFAVSKMLKAFCLLWNRQYDDTVFSMYMEAAKGFDSKTVEEATMDIGRTADWFPIPKQLRLMLETVRDRNTPRIAAESEVVVKASPDAVKKFMAELAERGVVADAKPRIENGASGGGSDADVGAESGEALAACPSDGRE